MTISDLVVIYFSIGAPCGVYVYFQFRGSSAQTKLWLKTVSAFFFWMPTVFRLLLNNKFIQNSFSPDQENDAPFLAREEKLYSIQKRLEKFSVESKYETSIYQFREMLQRYIGLTFAVQSASENRTEINKDFFVAAQNKNAEIAARCFQRRNRERLFFHQRLARQDFLLFVSDAFITVADRENFARLISEFVEVLQDGDAHIALEKICTDNSQRKNYPAVNSLEKDLWNPQEHKLSTANSISTLLP